MQLTNSVKLRDGRWYTLRGTVDPELRTCTNLSFDPPVPLTELQEVLDSRVQEFLNTGEVK